MVKCMVIKLAHSVSTGKKLKHNSGRFVYVRGTQRWTKYQQQPRDKKRGWIVPCSDINVL